MLALLDTRQEKAQLAATEAQHELARLTFERMQGLLNEGVISRAEFDRATAECRQTDAQVAEIRAVIQRKTIRAPFSGILRHSSGQPGTVLAGGNPLVTLQSLNPIYVNFGVPQQSAGQMKVGRTVHVTTDDVAGAEWTARVSAIDSLVDEATRNIQVQATLANPDGRLRPGMFVRTQVPLGPATTVVALPASAISYAAMRRFGVRRLGSHGRQRTVLSGVRQHFVKLGRRAATRSPSCLGIKAGDEVVTSGVFKLRNGAAVQINNSVQPANSAAPKPENS